MEWDERLLARDHVRFRATLPGLTHAATGVDARSAAYQSHTSGAAGEVVCDLENFKGAAPGDRP